MQKKTKPGEIRSSDWEKNLKKEEQKEKGKKLAIWAGIILVVIIGLTVLVKLAENSGPSTEPVVTENLKEVSAENDIIMGNPDAQVTIVEYADFQCPACANYNPVMEQILNSYPDQVRIVYRFFPIESIHKNALISAQAAWAAWKMDKFVEMKDELYGNQAAWEDLDDPRDEFIKYATSIGLDEAEFSELMNSKDAENAVLAGRNDALALGLNATPTFFIGKVQVSARDFNNFKELIDTELSGTEAKTTTAPLQ